ncbi:hypothetical protein [Edwardsiella tarda]|uniref:hypothetical protein n=1 Tax=Edwardsiella tarda TaxID=636 RepID=UPI0002D6584E|nr:hypothetical protein [Edwardsiella tarda]
MSGFFNSRGDVGFLAQNFNRNLAAGEKLNGSEFWMDIHGHEDISVLIRTTQIPELAREGVEDTGPMGLKFNQYGTLKNSGEITANCVETLEGAVTATVINLVKNKTYVDITIRATPESMGGVSSPALIRKLSHCTIGCDQVDFSTEDTTALVKPSLKITYNWVE